MLIGFHLGTCFDRVGDRVGDQAHARAGREGVGAAAQVLLEDVVLGGALQLGLVRGWVLVLGGHDVERQQPGGGGVDRHRGVHLVQRDAVQQRAHVALVGDRDADLADLAARQHVVGVIARLGGEIEGDRQPRLALLEVAAVQLVGALGVGMPRVGAHHPRPVALGQARGFGLGHRGHCKETDRTRTAPAPRRTRPGHLRQSSSRTRSCMPDQSSAATEHAILQEITGPLERLPDDALAMIDADFPTSLRGYDRVAVDEYVHQTRQLVAELQATRSPEAAVRRALERVGEQISGILQRAHETAEQITAQSRSEAEDRLEHARREAAQISQAAEDRVKELDADTDRIWLERQRIVADAEDLAGRLVSAGQGGRRSLSDRRGRGRRRGRRGAPAGGRPDRRGGGRAAGRDPGRGGRSRRWTASSRRGPGTSR